MLRKNADFSSAVNNVSCFNKLSSHHLPKSNKLLFVSIFITFLSILLSFFSIGLAPL